jgi:hypothetical protein
MCTIVILRRPAETWPVLIAANRDERSDRPWQPPGRHWPDRPDITAGLDALAHGSWLGINDDGVVAAALNRAGTLGPAAGKRSRGELVLEALDHGDAASAASALAALDPDAYRPFNLVVADNRDAFMLARREDADRIAVETLPAGLTMLTALDRDDPRSARIRLYRPRFAAAPIPDPGRNDWSAWEDLLGTRDAEPGGGPVEALFIDPVPPGDPGAFGTVSSSLLALPAIGRPDLKPVWRFASGPPERWRWQDVLPPAPGPA